MTEKRLNYNRAIVPQERGWWCGPAALQVVADGLGVRIPEATLAAEIEAIENPGRGDDKDGTDYIQLIEQVADRRFPDKKFTSVNCPNDPMSRAQKDRLWADLVRSIMDNNCGVIANIVAPPGAGRPRAVKGSVPPPYPPVTTWHYVALMGLDIDTKAVWVADSAAFGGITGWWSPFDGPGSICSLIPPKGYCYSAAVPATPPAPPDPPADPAVVIKQSQWRHIWQTHLEWLAITFGDDKAIDELVVAARNGDNRAKTALARLEQLNPSALQAYIAMKG
jgi:hypothetical protein